MRVRTQDPAAELSLNLAPMIDVVFLLLIFFMVATTFAQQEKEMSLNLPTAESGEEAKNTPEEIVINLMSDGRLRVAGQDIDEEGLEALLVRAARANAETPVTIRGDRDVVLQRVVMVMDACRRAGLTDIGIVHQDA
ncbi:MAG: biopolymer transporter ExbD [Planctomycetota bacterium]